MDKLMNRAGKVKKDPGIPNLHPFKQRMILKEQEQRAAEEQVCTTVITNYHTPSYTHPVPQPERFDQSYAANVVAFG